MGWISVEFHNLRFPPSCSTVEKDYVVGTPKSNSTVDDEKGPLNPHHDNQRGPAPKKEDGALKTKQKAMSTQIHRKVQTYVENTWDRSARTHTARLGKKQLALDGTMCAHRLRVPPLFTSSYFFRYTLPSCMCACAIRYHPVLVTP